MLCGFPDDIIILESLKGIHGQWKINRGRAGLYMIGYCTKKKFLKSPPFLCLNEESQEQENHT